MFWSFNVSLTTGTRASILTAEQINAVVVQPMIAQSVAAQISTQVVSSSVHSVARTGSVCHPRRGRTVATIWPQLQATPVTCRDVFCLLRRNLGCGTRAFGCNTQLKGRHGQRERR